MGKILSFFKTFFPIKIRKNIRFILEIHDVNPLFLNNIETIVNYLPEDLKILVAITPFYSKKNLSNKFNYLIRIFDKFRDVEFALHGYYHDLFEFRRINIEEASKRVENGLNFLKKYGIEDVYVFIPPNWALSKENLSLLKSYFDFTSTVSWIYNFRKKETLYSPLWIYGFGDIFSFLDYVITKINKFFSILSLFTLEVGIVRVVLHPENVFQKDLEDLANFLENNRLENILYRDL